jgi:hypothetical protein
MAADLTRSNDLIVLDGATFFFSDALGNAGTADAHGYFFDVVRHLSVWELGADGEMLVGIAGRRRGASRRTQVRPRPGAGTKDHVRR